MRSLQGSLQLAFTCRDLSRQDDDWEEMTTGKKELQEQLAKAEQKIADLEGELDEAKAEIERLTESRETEVQRWSEKLAAAQATTELAIAQEKERLRRKLTLGSWVSTKT